MPSKKAKCKWVYPRDNLGMRLLLTFVPHRGLWQYSDSHEASRKKADQFLTDDWVSKYYVEVEPNE